MYALMYVCIDVWIGCDGWMDGWTYGAVTWQVLHHDVRHVGAEGEAILVQRRHQRKVEAQYADAPAVAAQSHKWRGAIPHSHILALNKRRKE